MGIQPEPAAFLKTLPLPRGFSVCELGDQGVCGPGKNNPARPWYEALGCGRYVSIDANGRGTVTADLNRPLERSMRPRDLALLTPPFHLVTDFGTGEHIFDQAQVWRTLHALAAPGGYLAVDRPAQGYETHCYYGVHECLYRELAEANGYTVIWLTRGRTPRGELLRGVFQMPAAPAPFRVPQQGRYRKDLVI